jgi:2-methylisocitrate lyase-like PEP mutase family enzyme
LEEAIERGRLYAEAGADVIFIESPESEEELRQIAESIDAFLMVNLVDFGRTPLLHTARLEELGYDLVIYPVSLSLAAVFAMREILVSLRQHGTTETYHHRMVTLEDYHTMIGFPDVWVLEEKYGLKDYRDLEERFGRRT